MQVSPEKLRTMTTRVLAEAGLRAEDAETVASVLVYADLRGMWSHGVYRLENYVSRILAGGVNRSPDIVLHRRGPGAILVEGDHGIGPVVSMRATNAAIETARQTGVALVAVANSGHFGMASVYSELAAGQDQIGIVWTTTSAIMAPWGGLGRVLGNNPIAISAPRESGLPITLDMALSVVAGGRIRLAADRGEQIPLGWALDEAGKDTTDALAGAQGSVVPLGGYKGSGLSFMTEAIAVGLTSGVFGFEAPDLWSSPTAQQSVSHVVMTISIEHFVPVGDFARTVDRLASRVKATPSATGEEILLPGELEQARAAESEKGGIRLPTDSVRSLRSAAMATGLPLDEVLDVP